MMIDNISDEYIRGALRFYGVDDAGYEEKCLDALSKIRADEALRKGFDYVFSYLFSENFVQLWNYPDLGALFEKEPPAFTTGVILASGWELHEKNMERMRFDGEQTEIHIRRVHDCLTRDMKERGLEAVRFSQMVWGAYFTNCRVLEFGRLQYELKASYINLHIPAGEKLIIGDVLDSVRRSRDGVFRYFKVRDMPYCCHSWLLSPQLKELLPPDSNIMKFQTLFEIKEGPSCVPDILDFVYKTNGVSDYSCLPENTSLQRSLKKYLSEGHVINFGEGRMLI